MKNLKRLCSLLAISFIVFSCQKEYSVENNTSTSSTTAQWSFKEAGVEYKGPIDTVAFNSVGTSQIVTINGHSSDNKEEFALEIFGANLKIGTYKSPYCLFAYMRNGILVYQTNQTLVDSFSVVVTQLDSTGIAGTFSGVAFDTAKGAKRIVDGKFSSKFKSAGTITPPASTDSGQVVLWSKADCAGGTTGPVNVTINGKTGQIKKFVSAEPGTCDSTGGYSIKLPVGTYTWSATCGTNSVTGSVTVVKGGCIKSQVDLTAAVATGDYFPLTANSNWSYLYENSTSDDTLYTLSTGASKTFSGNQYALFTNQSSSSKDTSYYRKSGNTYYEYVPAVTFTDSGTVYKLPAYEYSFLIDNLATSATYASGPFVATVVLPSGASGTFNIYINSVVLDATATATINGSTAKVIKVKNTVSYKTGTNSIDIYAAEQWFAKGTGLIKYLDYNATPFTTPTDAFDLTRSKVY